MRCVYNSWKRLEENFYSSPLTHYVWQLSSYFKFQCLYSLVSQFSLFVQVLFMTVCKRKQNLERQANMVITHSPPQKKWMGLQAVIFLLHSLKKKGNVISSWCLLCRKEDPWQRKTCCENARAMGAEVETVCYSNRDIIICCTIKAWHRN